MGHKENGLTLAAQGPEDGVVEESATNMGVDGTEGIVKKDNVGVEVKGASDTDLCKEIH